MSRPTSSQVRTLERMEQAVRHYLEQTPELPEPAGLVEPASPPASLDTATEQLSLLANAVERSQANAAEVETLLQTEAEALSAWVETLIRVKTRLHAWGDDESVPGR